MLLQYMLVSIFESGSIPHS